MNSLYRNEMKEQIVEWIKFIEKPKKELSGFPVCPFAHKVRIDNKYTILFARNNEEVYQIIPLFHGSLKDVMIIYLDYSISVDECAKLRNELNDKYNKEDLVVLESHNEDPFIISGVETTFPHGVLLLLQKLSDLNEASEDLARTNYYSFWTKEQIQEVVAWRLKK
jgi:hypothetical protein